MYRPWPTAKAMRTTLFLTAMAASLPLISCGSGKFFVPTCQQTNSCGGGSSTYSSFAYVANQKLGTLAAFPLPSSTFTTISGTTYNLGAQPTALAATPKGTFLYVATTQGSVVVYSIGTNGTLTLGNNGSAVTSTLNPIWMTIDPSGNWLFMVSSSINALFEFQINTSTGVLTPVGAATGIPLASGSPTQIYVTPNDQNVYVGLGLGGLDGFPLNSATGALGTRVHLSPLNGGADNAISADNNSAYLLVGEAGSGIRVLKIGSGASLAEISGSPFQTQLGPRSIVVDPTNAYVYVANSTASVITGYSLDASGTLSQLSDSPFGSGSGPIDMSLDSTGKYLLVVSVGGSPDLQVFSFDATHPGALDSVATAATGTDPAGATSLTVVP